MMPNKQGPKADAGGSRSRLGTFPDDPGAYLLAIAVSAPLLVRIGKRAPVALKPGRYLYCGSAKGPGGIRARLARHLRRGKPIHWHIDQLTEAGLVTGAWAFPGGNECDLVRALSHLPVPIEGFGSTDCRCCASHLLRWPAGKPLDLSAIGARPSL